MKKRTQVTIRTRQRVLVQAVRVRCQQCGAEVPIISPESAAGVLQKTPMEITRLIAAGELHAVEEPSGSNVICGNSLSAADELKVGSDHDDLFKGEGQ